jgi:hypothetical protein
VKEETIGLLCRIIAPQLHLAHAKIGNQQTSQFTSEDNKLNTEYNNNPNSTAGLNHIERDVIRVNTMHLIPNYWKHSNCYMYKILKNGKEE